MLVGVSPKALNVFLLEKLISILFHIIQGQAFLDNISGVFWLYCLTLTILFCFLLFENIVSVLYIHIFTLFKGEVFSATFLIWPSC